MAKRPLGLASSKKNKKAKTSSDSATAGTASPSSASASQQPVAGQEEIHIEMDQEDDLEDEFTQLKGLWTTYVDGERDNEILLNGIIHECDRLMRAESSATNDKIKKTPEFYAIYALALSELAIFQEDEDDKKRFQKIHDFLESAVEFVDTGLDHFPESSLLNLVKSKIYFQRIPLEYIAQLAASHNDNKIHGNNDKEDRFIIKYAEPADLQAVFQKAQSLYTVVGSSSSAKKFDLSLSTNLSFEVLNSLNDLLDIVENFGNEQIYLDEGLDSDDEEEEQEMASNSHNLVPTHPLYKLSQHTDSAYEWLLENLVTLNTQLKNNKEENAITKEVSRAIGELYMKLSYPYSEAYTSLAYNEDSEDDDDDNEEDSEEESPEMKANQEKAIELLTSAKNYLFDAMKEDDPETWVNYSECLIELGNLYDVDSEDQLKLYKEAEKLLIKSNKATNGKYKDILNNLLSSE